MCQSTGPADRCSSTDNVYFWESVDFLVEGALFKVPKYHLVNGSKRFSEEYGIVSCNPTRDDDRDTDKGTTRRQPIPLNVLAGDFRSFLGIMYPTAIHCKLRFTKAEWISILKLATLWYFNEIRAIAIKELDIQGLNPLEKVTLGKAYNISRWLVTGYESLVNEEHAISMEEAKTIGFESSIRIFLCRERTWNGCLALIRETFAEEFAAVEEKEKEYSMAGDTTMERHPPKQKIVEPKSTDIHTDNRMAPRKEISRLKQLLSTSESENARLTSDVEASQCQVANYRAQLTKMAQDKAECDALSIDLGKSLCGRLRKVEGDRDRYRDERDQKAAQVTSLQQEANETRKRLEQFTKDAARLHGQTTKFKSERDGHAAQIPALQKDAVGWKKALANAQEEIHQLTSERDHYVSMLEEQHRQATQSVSKKRSLSHQVPVTRRDTRP